MKDFDGDIGERKWTYHSNEIDVEVSLAEFLLKLRIGQLRTCLSQNLDSVFEIANLSVVTGFLKALPSFGWDFVSDVRQVNRSVFLALKSIMTLAAAVLACSLSTLDGLMTLLLTDTAWTRSLPRLGALDEVSRQTWVYKCDLTYLGFAVSFLITVEASS